MGLKTIVLMSLVTPAIRVGPTGTWTKGVSKPSISQTNEWRPVLAQLLATIATASSTSDAPARESIAAAVDKEALLRVNSSGFHVQFTDDEKAVLRSALRKKDGVLDDMDWDEVAADIAVVSGYKRSWKPFGTWVITTAREMRTEAEKEAKQGGKQGGKNTGKKKAGKKEAKKVAERGPAKKRGKVKAKEAEKTKRAPPKRVQRTVRWNR
jgi:hypothetical protein